MSGYSHGLTTVVAALSLCWASTAVNAAMPADPVTASPAVASKAHSNPWLMLSAMTTSSESASSAAAAQGEAAMGFPPWPVLAVILATIAAAVFIVVQDDDDNLDFELPGSPA